MLDIKFIRENAEAVKANCKRRKYPADIDTILEIDADIRKLTREIDEMRAERNRLSKLCGADPEARPPLGTFRKDDREPGEGGK